MRAKTLNEVQRFERGKDPRVSMDIGGINFQEKFSEEFGELLEKWYNSLKTLKGKTIVATATMFENNDRQKSANIPFTIEVWEILEPGIRYESAHVREDKDLISLSLYVIGQDGKKYRLDLTQKIFIKN